MNGRRIALVIPILLTIAIPIGIARAPGRPAVSEPPQRPKSVLTQKVGGVVAVDSIPAPPSPEKPALTTVPPGWLRVRLALPEGLHDRAFEVVVFTSDGSIEQTFSDGDDQGDLRPLSPGMKAVLLFSVSGSLETATAIVTIVEGAETSLDLSLTASEPLRGEIVDASGRPVSGVEVQIEETLAYGEKFATTFQENLSHGLAGMGVSSAGSGGPTYACSIGEKGFQLTRGYRTDARGRFVLPRGENRTAVPVQISRAGKLIKEEVILASKTPLRLVVPGVAEPPKK